MDGDPAGEGHRKGVPGGRDSPYTEVQNLQSSYFFFFSIEQEGQDTGSKDKAARIAGCPSVTSIPTSGEKPGLMHISAQSKVSSCMQSFLCRWGLTGCVPMDTCAPLSLNADLHPRGRLWKCHQRRVVRKPRQGL